MPRRRSVVLLVALGVSLALNLYVAGVMLNQLRRPTNEDRLARYVISSMIGRGAGKFADRVRAELDRSETNIDTALADVRQARRDVRAAIHAEPFDQQRVAAALATLRTQNDRFRAELEKAVMRAAANATPQERALLTPRPPQAK